MGDWFDAIAPVHSVPLPHACRRIDIARGAALLVSLPRALIVRLPRAPSPRAARTPSLHLTWPSAAMDSSRKLDHGSASVFADSDETFAEDVFVAEEVLPVSVDVEVAANSVLEVADSVELVPASVELVADSVLEVADSVESPPSSSTSSMPPPLSSSAGKGAVSSSSTTCSTYRSKSKEARMQGNKKAKKQTYRCPPVEAR